MKSVSNIKGFTLIEMLVVVAVIGLLSSVILVALGPAKEKAKDARIIQEINQIRALAETFYNGNYDAVESLPSNNIQNPNLRELADDITSQGGSAVLIKSTPAPAKTYSVSSNLNIEGTDASGNPQTKYYCVDSAGRSITTVTPPTDAACPSP